MAAAVFLISIPPGSTSGVGSVSSSSGLPGWFSTTVNPLGMVSSILPVGGARATADVHGLARHEAGLVGGREDDRVRDLLGASQTLERDLARGVGDHRRRLPDLQHAFRLDGSRR